jgi:hypothetical protein
MLLKRRSEYRGTGLIKFGEFERFTGFGAIPPGMLAGARSLGGFATGGSQPTALLV